MKIRLEQLDDDPLPWNETLTVSPESLERPEVLALSGIECRGRVQRMEPGFLLRGKIRYEQTLRCDRCLASIEQPMEAEMSLLILTAPPARASSAAEAEDDDGLGVLHLEGDVFDTEPVVVEEIQLGVPMKPLCRPDCRGLCPRCGADLNLAACGCDVTETDPRWAALAALRDRVAKT